MLENIEPKRVMYYFEEISKIPRGSGNEKQISDYIVNFAKEHGLEFIQDEVNNVIIKKSSTNESSKTVILQAHIDMVCEKNKNVVHDFTSEPIKLKIDEDFIKAEGTTLGADNGIGVAYNLSILETSEVTHPNLEVVFTVDEEEGMTGAIRLDMSKLNGNTLINADSEEEGIITVGCAGGARVNIDINVNTIKLENPESFEVFELSVNGLCGGHSGIEIKVNRGNAIKILAEILKSFSDLNDDIYLYDIYGGMKVNAIPREATVRFVVNKRSLLNFLGIYNASQTRILEQYRENEGNLEINLKKLIDADISMVFSSETTKSIINILNDIVNGIYTMSSDVEGLVESSSNVGIVKYEDSKVKISIFPRSSKQEKLEEIINQITGVAKSETNTQVEVTSRYPSWDYEENSKAREVAILAYKELYGKEPIVEIIHAGLECAVFKEKNREIDMISIGPDIKGAHTPEECVSITSMQSTWEYMKHLLLKLSDV